MRQILQLNDVLRRYWGERDLFKRIMSLQGEVYRAQANRRTIRFVINGRGYFAKLHFGVGWREIFKNLMYGRAPVLGAAQEWRAIQRLENLQVRTMPLAGYGEQGFNPATRQSFVITEELANTVSLEAYCQPWRRQPPPKAIKQLLISHVARMASRLHDNGVNHRDFYLCHFLLDPKSIQGTAVDPRVYLIDLHRAQCRRRTPRRWIIKDLSGLFFSAMDIGLTGRDLLRFIQAYRQRSWREVLRRERRFWRAVFKRALKLYQREFGHHPKALPLLTMG